MALVIFLSLLLYSPAAGKPLRAEKKYLPPRPPIVGLHIAMSADSVELTMKKIARRQTPMKMDSLMLIESDSVRILGEAAYIQLQLLQNKLRTIVVNFHPLSGDHYLNTRNTLNSYMESYFGRGVITQDASVIYRRWETEDGTMEVSYSDKYTRVFLRLGKR